MIAGYTYMDDVVREAAQDVGDFHDHYWFQMYRFGIRCLEEMKIDMLNRPSIRRIPVDQDTKTVTLPADYVNYISIGVEYNGILWNLGYNPRMCRPSPDNCGDMTLGEGGLPNGLLNQVGLRNEDGTLQSYEGTFRWYDTSINPGFGQKQYGHGGGWNERGYYKVMHEDGIIMLNPSFDFTEIVLVYVSKAYTEGTKTLVPHMVVDCVKSYCKWKWFEYKSDISGRTEMRDWMSKAANHRQQYFAKFRLSQIRQRQNSPYEVAAAVRRSFGPHAKF